MHPSILMLLDFAAGAVTAAAAAAIFPSDTSATRRGVADTSMSRLGAADTGATRSWVSRAGLTKKRTTTAATAATSPATTSDIDFNFLWFYR